jgi:hypothetical protein
MAEAPQLKRCSKCGEQKPLDSFTRQKDRACGRASQCKECEVARRRARAAEKAEYDREYRAINAQRIRDAKAEYAAASKAEKQAYDRDYRAKHAARIAEAKSVYAAKNRYRAWYETNKREVLERQRSRLTDADREKARLRTRDWYRDHKQEVIAKSADRERRKKAASPAYRLRRRMTNVIWRSLRASKAGRPWTDLVGYSVEELMGHLEAQFVEGMSWDNLGEWHLDHIYPGSLFRFNSPDDVEFALCWSLHNLRPMWGPDNTGKGDKLPDGRTARSLSDGDRLEVVTELLQRWFP